jgi:hypothetical protein
MITVVVVATVAVVGVLGAVLCAAFWHFGWDAGFAAGQAAEELTDKSAGRYEPKSIVAMAGIEGDWTEND